MCRIWNFIARKETPGFAVWVFGAAFVLSVTCGEFSKVFEPPSLRKSCVVGFGLSDGSGHIHRYSGDG